MRAKAGGSAFYLKYAASRRVTVMLAAPAGFQLAENTLFVIGIGTQLSFVTFTAWDNTFPIFAALKVMSGCSLRPMFVFVVSTTLIFIHMVASPNGPLVISRSTQFPVPPLTVWLAIVITSATCHPAGTFAVNVIVFVPATQLLISADVPRVVL